MKKITTLAEAFAAYARHNLFDASAATLNQFRVSLKHAARTLGREVTLDDLTDDLILDVIQRLRANGRAEATANKCRSNLLAIWRWLCRKGHKQVWPDVAKVKEPRRIPVAWTRPELRRLFVALGQLHGHVAEIPARLWWVALHSVIWDTGERIGAVLKLRWSDISGDSVLIRAETRKGRTEDRVHRLHPTTVRTLAAIRRDANDLVFPWDRRYDVLWSHYASILKRAGLPADRRTSSTRCGAPWPVSTRRPAGTRPSCWDIRAATSHGFTISILASWAANSRRATCCFARDLSVFSAVNLSEKSA